MPFHWLPRGGRSLGALEFSAGPQLPPTPQHTASWLFQTVGRCVSLDACSLRHLTQADIGCFCPGLCTFNMLRMKRGVQKCPPTGETVELPPSNPRRHRAKPPPPDPTSLLNCTYCLACTFWKVLSSADSCCTIFLTPVFAHRVWLSSVHCTSAAHVRCCATLLTPLCIDTPYAQGSSIQTIFPGHSLTAWQTLPAQNGSRYNALKVDVQSFSFHFFFFEI